MTHAERILALLATQPAAWFDDDELSAMLHIRPRQTVNQVCRRLAGEGRIRREVHGNKICNALATSAQRPVRPTGLTDLPQGPARTEAATLLRRCADTMSALHVDDAAARLRRAAAASDTRQVLVECRWALERMLAACGVSGRANLAQAIDDWSGTASSDVRIVRQHMHTVRVLGNEAAHGVSTPDWSDVSLAARALSLAAERMR